VPKEIGVSMKVAAPRVIADVIGTFVAAYRFEDAAVTTALVLLTSNSFHHTLASLLT
jgi:hypothetical protein